MKHTADWIKPASTFGTSASLDLPAGFEADASLLRYTLTSTQSEIRTHTLWQGELALTENSELRWWVFPSYGHPDSAELLEWQRRGYGSTGITLDVELDDGSWASEQGVRDQYSDALHPDSQGESKKLYPDQWNLRRVDLSPLAGIVAVRVVVRVRSVPGQTAIGWIRTEPIATRRGPSSPATHHVDTRRGSNSSHATSRGNTYPMTARPNAFVAASPVTDAGASDWFYTYGGQRGLLEAGRLEAFAVCRSPTPWLGDFGVLHFFPSSQAAADRPSRAMSFDRYRETARPHLYEVAFDAGITVSLTSTDHCIAAKVAFPPGDRFLLLDQIDGEGSLDLTAAANGRISGYSDYVASSAGAAGRVWFALEASSFFVDSDHFAERASTHGFVQFASAAAPTEVEVRIATSYISIEQARRNLSLEMPPGFAFEELRDDSAAAWAQRLRRFDVDGADEDLATFYASLYRLSLFPMLASENAGSEREPDWLYANLFDAESTAKERSPRPGTLYVGNGYWDTYRTVWPALFFFYPEQARTLITGVLEQYRAGGWMARWSAPGYTDCMVGTSSDVVFATALAHGIEDFETLQAYDSALRNAMTASPALVVGRKGNLRSRYCGFVSSETHEGLSWTMESAIADAAIAEMSTRLASLLGAEHPRSRELETNAAYFTSRAASYANLWDPATRFFRGRDERGRFPSSEDFDPCAWGGDYTETNAWGMLFSAPQDPGGLIELHGGADGLRVRLDEFFSTDERADSASIGAYGRLIHEMTEARDVRMGMFGLSNQPAHHIPFMYAYTSTPHRMVDIVHEGLRRCFVGSDLGQGYPGDEDNGEMSAWYVFASMGLYPLFPASGEYIVSAPYFDRLRVDLEGGPLLIECRKQDPGSAHRYIQSVIFNGDPQNAAVLSHEQLRGGGHLVFELGDDPAPWCEPLRADPLPALTDNLRPGDRLTDNRADGSLSLEVGDAVVLEARSGAVGRLYTVSVGLNSPEPAASWALLGRTAHGWQILDEQADVLFRWPSELRVFPLPEIACDAYQFVAASSASYSQLEVLVDGHRIA